MFTIPFGTAYDVLLGEDILPALLSHPQGVKPGGRCAVFTDTTVEGLHAGRLAALLARGGVSYEIYAIPPGETSKTMEALSGALSFLAKGGFDRADTVLALGGGVVGDLAALAASLYHRGMRLIQIPTTLIAACDAALGGKCAVDLPEGKNLAGTFYSPALVLCDTSFLATLSEQEFSCGMAEVLKYAIGFDRELFTLCEEPKAHLTEILQRCITLKRGLVLADPLDRGVRRKLNLGHTAAHAIEALSGYTVPHGVAVGMGLSLTVRRFLPEEAEAVDALLKKNGLKTEIPYDPEALARAALSDKKRTGDHITLCVPTAPGACELKTVPLSFLPRLFSGEAEA